MTPDQLREWHRWYSDPSADHKPPEGCTPAAVMESLLDHADALEEIERLRAKLDAAFAMSRCECESNECCANLVKAQERAEQAERRAERLKVHAEESHSLLIRAMAYTPTDCSLFDDMHKRLKAYRADKGE